MRTASQHFTVQAITDGSSRYHNRVDTFDSDSVTSANVELGDPGCAATAILTANGVTAELRHPILTINPSPIVPRP